LAALLLVLNACNFPAGRTPTEAPAPTQTGATVGFVSPTPTASLLPTATGTSEPVTSPQGSAQAPTRTGSGCTDQAIFISDVTINDNTELIAGEEFVKVWRLENSGTCTWTSDYRLAFFGGDRMQGALEVPLMDDVAPGEQVEVSVDLVAPDEPGDYLGLWKLRNDQSQFFGIGPAGDQSFWVKIVVLQPALTGTPTSTVTSTQTAGPSKTPTPSPTATGTPSATPE
jgi:hypothetical protein